MNPTYPVVRFTIRYDSEKKKFTLWNGDDVLVGEDVNGRELGRDAWRNGAEEVRYEYDLSLDEAIPLISVHAKYKARN